MDEYTPTTEHIRASYIYGDMQYDGSTATPVRIANAEFDRWLASVKAEAARDVLRNLAHRIDLEEIAEEWAERAGNDAHWAAGNAASAVQMLIFDEANRFDRKAVCS